MGRLVLFVVGFGLFLVGVGLRQDKFGKTVMWTGLVMWGLACIPGPR